MNLIKMTLRLKKNKHKQTCFKVTIILKEIVNTKYLILKWSILYIIYGFTQPILYTIYGFTYYAYLFFCCSNVIVNIYKESWNTLLRSLHDSNIQHFYSNSFGQNSVTRPQPNLTENGMYNLPLSLGRRQWVNYSHSPARSCNKPDPYIPENKT